MLSEALDFCDSPFGKLVIKANENGITAVQFASTLTATVAHKATPSPLTKRATAQLESYFKGKLKRFDLPLAVSGTSFQMRVWRALQTICYGETASYSDIAQLINAPKAVRAVGAANGKNPLAIVVPCHRVVGKNGTLTGYVGGLTRKQQLLALEQPSAAIELTAYELDFAHRAELEPMLPQHETQLQPQDATNWYRKHQKKQ